MAGAERAIEYAVGKLGQLLDNEIKLLKEVYDNVDRMQSELRWMKGFLEDADTKGKNGDNMTKIWIRDLTNIAHEAEDVVDTFMSHFETKNIQCNCPLQFIWTPSKLVGLHCIGTEIERIKDKLHDIKEKKDRYGINNFGEPGGSVGEYLRTQRNINPHLSGNNIFVGFGGPKKLILERLIDPKVKKLVVVPIVGMGGLGKTTLATQIYNDDVTKDWFKYRAWVAVSEDFKPLELLRKIIKQVLGDSEKYNSMDVEELKVLVHECLEGQRYFVVLDDIWEQDQDVWLQLKGMFPDVGNGSRVLVTTRFIGVGKSIDPSNEPYELPYLDDKESWQLFLNVVFPSKEGSEPECIKALETLGKDLVKKCGGLPLGVIMLGGLLRATDSTVNAWNKVVNAWNKVATRLNYRNLQILAPSYKYLPNVNMKLCFLYIGIYPEDHIIKASELTKFWIAEGFIPIDENQTFEETAKDYLDEFVLRCMVQVVARTKTSKRVKFFRIHDLFRKWCISEARQDGFFRIWNSNCDTTNSEIISARRLIIYNSTLEDKFNDLSYKARAILGFNDLSVGNFLLSNIGQNFKLLRVIYLTFPQCEKINKSKSLKQISRLVHLRNITLKSQALTYLPSSIGKLRNLQTLNVKHTSILKLPKTLHEIHDLRHLYTGGSSIKSSSTWKSTNLQTLDSISAGSLMLNDFTKLLKLRKLSICGITQNEVRRLQDSLCRLSHLKSLCLESDGQPDPSLFTSFNHDHPLSKLVLINWSNISCKFPQNLISIRLSSCTFEKGVLASLANLLGLVNLKLEDCGIHPEDKFVFSANDFHQLENLHIDEMRSLLDWEILDGALPKIKCLTIGAKHWLTMLPEGLKHLKSLQMLEMVFPNENLKRRLVETLEDRRKIPQIPSVTLNGKQLNQYTRLEPEPPEPESVLPESVLPVPAPRPPKPAPRPPKPKSAPMRKPMPKPKSAAMWTPAAMPMSSAAMWKPMSSAAMWKPMRKPMPTSPRPPKPEPLPEPPMRAAKPPEPRLAPEPPNPPSIRPEKEEPKKEEPKKEVFPNNNLERRLIETLEDRQKIPQIPSVTLNDIRLDQYKWSSEKINSREKMSILDADGFTGIFDHCRVERGPGTFSLCHSSQPQFHWGKLHSAPRKMEMKKAEKMKDKIGDGLSQIQSISSTPAPSFGSGRVSGRIIRSSTEMSEHDDEPILSSQDVSGGEHASYVMGRTKLTVIKTMVAPLIENKYNVMLEVMGLNHVGNRPGVDFVTVLDVNSDNLVIMKSAMKFFIQKLSSNDRLSIIIMSSSARPIKIFPLRQITESFLVEVGSFENIPDITTAMNSAYRNITACIKKGLEVLSDRRFTTGRKAAIMLMSDGIHNFYDYGIIPQAQFLNIPVYTFGLREDCDPRVLKRISSLTVGGTFSYIRNSKDLNIAFSQSFSDLFGVATRDLKLTLKQIESTILTVYADNYTQFASEIVTIHFGDLYVNELRKVELDLFLPAVKSHCSNDVLEITSRDADAVVHRSILIDVARCETSAERDMDDYEPDDGEKLTIHPA